MAAPIITIHDENDVELNQDNPNNLGVVNAGSSSNEKILKIKNNANGTGNVSAMEEVTITTVTKEGYNTGDTVENGKEAIEGRWLQIKSITDDDLNFSPVGGTIVKNISNIRGDKLATPGQPIGTPNETPDGNIPQGTYYYRISALDETGETLPGPEVEIVISGSDNTVDISWETVEGATSYKIFRTKISGDYNESSLLVNLTTNTYTDKLPDTNTGQPLAEETVTYEHLHELKERLDIPSNATGGTVEMNLRISYAYI